MKDPVSKMNRSGLVYKVKCKGCEGVYYGETMQYLNKRMQQHRNDVSRGSKTTALAEHAIGKGHVMDLENVEVVCTERNTRKRKFLEAVHIVKDRNSINFQKDSEMVSESYFGIIHGPGNGG